MSRRSISLMGLLAALVLTAGCFNSESDYQRLVEEKNLLAAELATAKQENAVLNQALANIKLEQERLQLLLNASRKSLGTAGSSAVSPSGSGSAAYSWGGWDWTPPADARPGVPSRGAAPAAAAPAAATPTAAAPAATPTAAGSASGKIYRPKSGDILSGIASRNNTTVERLVELNPYLKDRRNYMIWETDKIVLP